MFGAPRGKVRLSCWSKDVETGCREPPPVTLPPEEHSPLGGPQEGGHGAWRLPARVSARFLPVEDSLLLRGLICTLTLE